MNGDRAKQIFDSYGIIEVTYEGAPVWIENVKGDTAEVTNLKSNEKMEVSVDRLKETVHTL